MMKKGPRGFFCQNHAGRDTGFARARVRRFHARGARSRAGAAPPDRRWATARDRWIRDRSIAESAREGWLKGARALSMDARSIGRARATARDWAFRARARGDGDGGAADARARVGCGG